LGVVAYIAADRERPVAAGDELVGSRFHRVLSEVGQNDSRASFGKRLSGRQSHA
jgi:hypothetical protein